VFDQVELQRELLSAFSAFSPVCHIGFFNVVAEVHEAVVLDQSTDRLAALVRTQVALGSDRQLGGRFRVDWHWIGCAGDLGRRRERKGRPLLLKHLRSCRCELPPVVEGWPRGCLVMRRHVRGWKSQLTERRGVVDALLQDFHRHLLQFSPSRSFPRNCPRSLFLSSPPLLLSSRLLRLPRRLCFPHHQDCRKKIELEIHLLNQLYLLRQLGIDDRVQCFYGNLVLWSHGAA